MELLTEVQRAAERLAGRVAETPVAPAPALGARGGGPVALKLEHLQRTGSFKLRGALNVLLAMTAEERARGVVAASTGNHGLAVACAAAELGARALVFAPESASAAKLARVAELGADVRRVGEDCLEAERAARAHAAAHGQRYVSPYDDPLVVAGGGTVGLELARQLERLDAVYVAVGGGGLISGVAGALKGLGRAVEVVGVSPQNSCVMQASLAAGRILELPSLPTLSDATAGGVDAEAITFALCRRLVDRFVLVDEDRIAAAWRLVGAPHGRPIEGAAACAVAGYLADDARPPGAHAAVVLCGGNADEATLARVFSSR